MRKFLSALCLAPLLLLAVSGCERQSGEANQAEASEAPSKGVDRSHKGDAVPASEIFNSDEDEAALSEAIGKPTLVNLWASWCAPCVKELPTLQALSKRPGAPAVIIVSEDIGERASVEAFLDGHAIRDLESWRDPNMAISGALGVQVMPTTVYYDASGRELWRYVGDLDWTGDEAARLLANAGGSAGS
jgi:thiol-disulfide isomerase/thioredoxin